MNPLSLREFHSFARFFRPHLAGLFDCAPLKVIFLIAVFILLQLASSVSWQLAQPYFKLNLNSNNGANLLDPTVTLHLPNSTLQLNRNFFSADPDNFNSFQDFHHYLALQQLIYQALNDAEEIKLEYTPGNVQTFHPHKKTLIDIPSSFWIYNLVGAFSLLLCVSFWAFHRGRAETRILALSGVGCAIMQFTMAFYTARDFVLAENLFKTMILLNHFGGMLFAYSCLLLFMVYPNRIASNKQILASALLVMLIMLNEAVAAISWPINIFYFPVFLIVGAAIMLIFLQWRKCKIYRIRLVWMVFSITSGFGSALLFYVLPIFFTGKSLLPLELTNLLLILVFIGFLLGIHQSQLFEIEFWWFRSWAFSAVVVLLAVADIATLSISKTDVAQQVSLIGLLICWIYWPFRRWLWHKIILQPALFFPSDKSVANNLREQIAPIIQALQHAFNPLCVKLVPYSNQPNLISQHGLSLNLPCTEFDLSIQLVGNQKGLRLFLRTDIAQAKSILAKINHKTQIETEIKQELNLERERIMRDLHDDVSGDLLTLIHQSETLSLKDTARNALTKLRNIVYSIDSENNLLFCERLNEFRNRFAIRCTSANIKWRWQQSENISHYEISTLDWNNLSRAMNEAINNCIRHASPTEISLIVSCQKNFFSVLIRDSGQHTAISHWKKGKGLISIEYRLNQLSGSALWRLEKIEQTEYCVVELRFPFSRLRQVNWLNKYSMQK